MSLATVGVFALLINARLSPFGRSKITCSRNLRLGKGDAAGKSNVWVPLCAAYVVSHSARNCEVSRARLRRRAECAVTRRC